jgi:cyclic pyranopterin phosphate synthase
MASREGEGFSHLDEAGSAHMVDVSGKAVSARTASARGRVEVSAQVIELLRGDGVPKGDALAVARIAGIQAAKRTPDLIPLCHPLPIDAVSVDLEITDDAVVIRSSVTTTARTGVEMEALSAVAVAGLTVVDMVKSVDKHARITDIEVIAKSGGRSGDWSIE